MVGEHGSYDFFIFGKRKIFFYAENLASALCAVAGAGSVPGRLAKCFAFAVLCAAVRTCSCSACYRIAARLRHHPSLKRYIIPASLLCDHIPLVYQELIGIQNCQYADAVVFGH